MNAPSLPLFHVDAFTSEAFRGNPAAVCLLEGPAPESWMLNVAREMNLSETAFVAPLETPGEFGLRWFTPKIEVDLCGHATLASAHVLWRQGVARPAERIRFQTRSGWLEASLEEESGAIELDFPLMRPVEAATPAGLAEALGMSSREQLRWMGTAGPRYFVEADSEATVRALRPDFAKLSTFGNGFVSFIVTARAEAGREHDFVSRFFDPDEVIQEDPVTGSAHCTLAPYWSARLGRDSLTGFQASSRGGLVRMRLERERVILGGNAVTVVEGRLLNVF
jgi:PhzF family phenazine biosynthesis protein